LVNVISSGTFATLAVSLAAALLGTPLFLRAARRFGLLDRPNARSGHTGVTPRGGGVVVLLAAALSLALTASGRGASPAGLILLAGAALMALVGLVDDRVRLSVAPKMTLQWAIAAAVVWTADAGIDRLPLPAPLDVELGRWGGLLLSVLWIVGAVNFYNFLDGIDGLAALQGVVTGAGMALAGWSPLAAAAGAALCGACLGFLFFNWSPARIFLGDAGSALLGYAFAALPLMAPGAVRPAAVFFAGLSLWLFLADALWTIGRRLALGQDVLAAHREHVYQRLVDGGRSHRDVALGVGLGSLALTAIALLAWWSARPLLGWAALAAAVAAFALELLLLRGRGGRSERGSEAVRGTREGALG
jgi:UDP-N-acetylmuramyl pentapeptide phosphotransferase/UDP-N-acetylglucosamine-1-phosphate transferase